MADLCLRAQDPVAVVLATVEDYFDDFTVLLEAPFLPRVAQAVFRNVVADYLARLCKAYREEGLTALSKSQVDLVVFDRTRFLALLEQRQVAAAWRLLTPRTTTIPGSPASTRGGCSRPSSRRSTT
jgi:ABC-type amino acid transport substrate-binding protein